MPTVFLLPLPLLQTSLSLRVSDHLPHTPLVLRRLSFSLASTSPFLRPIAFPKKTLTWSMDGLSWPKRFYTETLVVSITPSLSGVELLLSPDLLAESKAVWMVFLSKYLHTVLFTSF